MPREYKIAPRSKRKFIITFEFVGFISEKFGVCAGVVF